MDKVNLSSLNLDEINELIMPLGASSFRARQIFNWVYLKSAKSIDDMTDLSKKFRDELNKIATITTSTIKRKQTSKDGTIKYLIEYSDGECVETVLMRFDNRANLTACVSSQVGCSVNCKFCATGKRGFVRNLTCSEIIEQVLTIQRDTGLKITNIVFMGQGEPLLNLDNVLKAIDFINTNLVVSQRLINFSTSCIIPKIKELAYKNLQITLALSLHAPNSDIRKTLMQIDNKYPMSELKHALKYYNETTGRRITIEYLLIKGVNDRIEHAKETAQYLSDIKCNVNLIPYNPVDEAGFKRPNNDDIMKFKCILEHSGKKVTIRLERGSDIDAACGQLRGKVL